MSFLDIAPLKKLSCFFFQASQTSPCLLASAAVEYHTLMKCYIHTIAAHYRLYSKLNWKIARVRPLEVFIIPKR